MTRAEQLDWERRTGRSAAAAAFAAAVALIGGTIYLQASLTESPDAENELFEVVDRQPADFIVAGGIQALGLLLLIPVLLYLYRATRFRRPELPKVALVLAIAGPAAAAVIGLLRQVELVNLAGDFVAGEPIPRKTAEARAEDLIDESSFPVIGGVGFGANLALGFAVVLLSLNAMRAGLTSRFMGIIGIIIGVLYVLPVAGGPQVVQLFWLAALAALFLGRWPGGRGPAWDAGEAVPWPSAAEQREAQLRAREREVREEEAPEPAESVDPDTPRPRSKKRRRKRR